MHKPKLKKFTSGNQPTRYWKRTNNQPTLILAWYWVNIALVLNWYCLKSLPGRCTVTHAVVGVVALGHTVYQCGLGHTLLLWYPEQSIDQGCSLVSTHPALAMMTPLYQQVVIRAYPGNMSHLLEKPCLFPEEGGKLGTLNKNDNQASPIATFFHNTSTDPGMSW